MNNTTAHSAIDDSVRAEIMRRIKAAEAEHNVKVLFSFVSLAKFRCTSSDLI